MRKKETKREINEKNRTGDMYVYLFGVYLKYEYFIIIIISFSASIFNMQLDV